MRKWFTLKLPHPAQGSAKYRRWMRRLEKKLIIYMEKPEVKERFGKCYAEMALYGQSRFVIGDSYGRSE